VPDGWSAKIAEREARKAAAAFELKCKSGEVQNREEKRQAEEAARLEAAKLKTLSQYVNGVYMPTKEATFSENARASYRMFLDKHILPSIGDLLLTDISSAVLTKLLVDFVRAGYSHSTAIKLYNILNGIFQMAFLDDSIPQNPMLKVKRPAPRKDEKAKEEGDKAYTVQELNHIFSCLQQEPLKWQVFIHVAADTGMRRGEVCALQWPDIDFKTMSVKVSRNLQYTSTKGVYVTTPKNGKSRIVDMGGRYHKAFEAASDRPRTNRH
jgi:integrase